MIVLIAWVVAGVVALIVLAALALGLTGHARRLVRAATEAERDINASLRVLSVVAARREGHKTGMDVRSDG